MAIGGARGLEERTFAAIVGCRDAAELRALSSMLVWTLVEAGGSE